VVMSGSNGNGKKYDRKDDTERILNQFATDESFAVTLKKNGVIELQPRKFDAFEKEKINTTKREIAVRLISRGASYSQASYAIGITPTTFASWVKENPDFKNEVELAKGKLHLKLQDKLDWHIFDDHNLGALLFHLKTAFGYNEQMTLKVEGQIEHLHTNDLHDLKNVTTAMRLALARDNMADDPLSVSERGREIGTT